MLNAVKYARYEPENMEIDLKPSRGYLLRNVTLRGTLMEQTIFSVENVQLIAEG
jgi:hypothetical protein